MRYLNLEEVVSRDRVLVERQKLEGAVTLLPDISYVWPQIHYLPLNVRFRKVNVLRDARSLAFVENEIYRTRDKSYLSREASVKRFVSRETLATAAKSLGDRRRPEAKSTPCTRERTPPNGVEIGMGLEVGVGKCTSLFVLLVEVGGINESIREVRSVREKRTSIERLGKGERRGIAELLAVVLPLPEDLRNCSMYQLHDESRCINYLLADK
uniref:Uncharacterized protein n=1 Tax=Vespula pensylvanica TaxID=30213 RepID=A0A834PDG1_VESPE|nr:hypothetical protein H0235_003685 [Vespula pensylvanica]